MATGRKKKCPYAGWLWAIPYDKEHPETVVAPVCEQPGCGQKYQEVSLEDYQYLCPYYREDRPLDRFKVFIHPE
jgi:hypothetical protein